MHDRRVSQGIYEFYNANPKNSVKAPDCVIRSISKATGRSWDAVFDGLCDVARVQKSLPNAKDVFSKYLTNTTNFVKCPMPRKTDRKKYTVNEFAVLHPKGTYIILLAKHLTVMIDGIIYDTWNCTDGYVGNYWKEKKNEN